jgi:Eukaryotic aspartyl protease
LIASHHILNIKAVPGKSISQRYYNVLFEPEETLAAHQEKVVNIRESVYITEIKFGSETFKSVIDTGSADTWIVQHGFICLNPSTKLEISSHRCKFSKTYNLTKSWKPIPDQHYNISYMDGEFLNGKMGRETVTLGGIPVDEQEVGLVHWAAWNGDGYSSGLVGLAFPSVTRAYQGLDPQKDVRGASVPYDPIFTSMWKKNLTEPYFSVALNRFYESPGAIAFGGLPGPNVRFASDWVKTPMRYLHVNEGDKEKPIDYQFYVVEVDGWEFNNTENEINYNSLKHKTILDTGSTLTLLPEHIVSAINGGDAWDPPAVISPTTKQWVVKCNAKPPKVGIKLGNQTLHWQDEDLISATGGAPDCVSGIQPGKTSILGGTFLKGVVAVFDIGAAEIRLAQRIR